MKTRVLHKNGCYIPQMRPTLWPFWYNITDDIFERESDQLDCYNSELDPKEIAECCAIRKVRDCDDYIGCVKWKSISARILLGLRGPQGAMGGPGHQGPAGPRGEKCGALDLQCPKCHKFISDYPRQKVVFELKDGNSFDHACAKCKHSETWSIFEGLPIPHSMLKDARNAAFGGREAS